MERPAGGLWSRLTQALPGASEGPDRPAVDRPLGVARPPRPRAEPQDADCAEPGEFVARRYRLDELLVRRGPTLTWLATDDLLGRRVLVHLLDHREPDTLAILDEARRAAPATDARILRVLDADLAEGQRYGAYIVCEYAPGQSLELALEQGPFAPRQACRIVGEVADALAAMHRQGLYHRHLDPDTVILTTAGGVKLVGFLIEAALAGRLADDPDAERRDVTALGALLYATLTGRWPGSEGFGLPAAPTDRRGRLRPPSALQRGVPTDVGELALRLLDPDAAPQTAAEASAELDGLLHRHTGELDRRLYQPVAIPRRTGRTLPSPTAGESTQQLESTGLLFDPFAEDDELTGRLLDDPDDEQTPFTPIPPPARPDPHGVELDAAPAPRHGWLKGLAVLFVVALVASLAGVAVNQLRGRPEPTSRPVLPVASVRDFDPKADGGDGTENAVQARLAVDGSGATAWTSERYGKTAAFNGRKPGVGLLLDLGSEQPVSSVTATVAGTTNLELRVPVTAGATEPPLTSAKQWRTVTTASGTGEVVLSAPTPVRTRYVLVYVTKLPAVAQGFQAGVAEVAVRS